MREHSTRREFIGRLGATSAAAFVGEGALSALANPHDATSGETWDMSWVEKLKTPAYKAVIDANTLDEGYALDLASGLYSTYKDVHGAGDDQVRIVIVSRRGGTPLVLGDAIWDKYPVGADTKMMDAEGSPYRRNPFYRPRAGASPDSAARAIESLSKRGAIFLVCNVAANNWARSLAEKTKRDQEEVKRDVFANFVPGTIVMPSGVFALMRAQNAGCAYMRGQ